VSVLNFEPEAKPFPRWMGPFSPARGTLSGFRLHQRELGTWVGDEAGRGFWSVREGAGAAAIANLVRSEWGGGRVLLLPNGFVVKPLQTDEEVGRRAIIGRFHGPVALETAHHGLFDLSDPGVLRPGDPWPGPRTTGLECAIQSDGSLACSWYHPTRLGRDEVSESLRTSDRVLAAGFRAARPGDAGGRVRITANGHVITNRQERDGAWTCLYVGFVDSSSWASWEHWVERRRT
jgi:hypothetical protein